MPEKMINAWVVLANLAASRACSRYSGKRCILERFSIRMHRILQRRSSFDIRLV